MSATAPNPFMKSTPANSNEAGSSHARTSMGRSRRARLGSWAWASCLLSGLLTMAAIGVNKVNAQVTEPPDSMPYHGVLLDADGVGLGSPNPTNYDLVFRIYDAVSGGNLLWSEQQTVTVSGGYFSVELGVGGVLTDEPRPNLSSIFRSSSASERHLEISVKGVGLGGSAYTVVPRMRLLAAPYSMLARHSISADSLLSDGTSSALSITGNRVGINQSILSAELNGANSLAMPPTTLGGAITVEAWVNPRSHALWQRIVDFGNGPQNNNIILAASMAYSGRPIFQVFSGSNPVISLEAPSAIPLNTWTHVAAVLGQDLTGSLFINGQLVASGKATALPLAVARANAFIGKSNWPDALLDGSLADVRIWAVARTAAEIQGSMRAGSIGGPTAGLRAAYPFGLTGASSLADVSGNNLTLTASSPMNFPRVASQPIAELDVNGNIVGSGVEVNGDLLVAGTMTAESWEGLGIVPVGTIILWSGDAPPDDWALCNGQVIQGVQTPDLRGRFVLGVGQGLGLTERRIGDRGGSEEHVLVAAELPSHAHSFAAGRFDAFSLAVSIRGDHTHSLKSEDAKVGWFYAPREGQRWWDPNLLGHALAEQKTSVEGSHAHRVDISPAQTSAQGGGRPHPTLPPFYALAYIMRVR